MIAAIKRVLRRTTPLELASRELAESELIELTYQTSQEFAAAMVAYHQNKARRLRAFISKQSEAAV